MARHSFIQMSKLPNVKGRISYITSPVRQENLYAAYRTADNDFGVVSQGKASRNLGEAAQTESVSKRGN